MTQTEQPQANKPKTKHHAPKAVGVYDRPEPKKRSPNLIVAVAVLILLSLLAFWLMPMLFGGA